MPSCYLEQLVPSGITWIFVLSLLLTGVSRTYSCKTNCIFLALFLHTHFQPYSLIFAVKLQWHETQTDTDVCTISRRARGMLQVSRTWHFWTLFMKIHLSLGLNRRLKIGVGNLKPVARKQAQTFDECYNYLALLSDGGEACFNAWLVEGIWKQCSSFIKGMKQPLQCLSSSINVH